MNKKLPKTLYLDIKTWRSGGSGKNRVGCGTTTLLNKEGYMCCLGQFCKQVGLKDDDILMRSSPDELEHKVNTLNRKGDNSQFSLDAMEINDDEGTTPSQKVKKLQSLCKKYNRKLVIKNSHLLEK